MDVSEIDAEGGVQRKKPEVVMYDRRTRNEDMVNAARRFIRQDGVPVTRENVTPIVLRKCH